MKTLLALLASLACAAAPAATVITHTAGHPAVAKATASANPILFVTAMPVGGFASNTATFAMQKTDMQSGGRGGDLYIRYPDGTLRNLTAEAGYGSTGANGFQDHNAIAVRNPDVYWDGTKAIFSMVIGAPDRQYQQGTWYWQLYEVTGLQQGGHAVITKVAGQPADFNNIMPTYGSNGSIIFVSDMPHGGPSHRYAYPQLDEYESTPTPTGLWKLQGGVVTQLTDAPSGDFHPRVDWYGRIVFTEWDHVQRDQQCDTAAAASAHGCFDYASEADGAPTTTSLTEVFPELRIGADQSHINNHTFNLFQPWAVNQDGTTLEMVDHVGRHELQGYFNRSFTDDPNIRDYTAPNTPTRLENCHQLQPEATDIGKYLCVDAPEFETRASGSIVELALPLGAHADQQPPPRFITSKANNHQYNPPSVPPADYTGHYRDPIKLLDGTIVAAWTYQSDSYKLGDRANPTPNYDFRLISLTGTPPNMSKGAFLTPGISKSISYFDPDVRVTYNGPLWELQPVEVVARPEPPTTTTALEPPELAAFSEAGVDPAALKAWMVSKNLALFVSRNVTSRDDADRQQPFNLRVPGGTQSIGASGKIYDISTMQFFEGDAVRGYNGRAGRRKLARFMTDPAASAANTPLTPAGAPPGSVTIYPDGSVAAFVPAQKAITWATVAPDLSDVVRERYWLTGQPGEIRACDSCHGTNTLNQAGQPPPQNTPQALVALAQYWKAQNGGGPPTNQPPVASFTFTLNGLSASFTDTSTDPDGTIASRAWDFGDGLTSTAQNPPHTYAQPGTYQVKLTVTDNGGLPGSVTHPVTVAAPAGPKATVSQGTTKCPTFDAVAGFTIKLVPATGAPGASIKPAAVAGYVAVAVQGTKVCTLPSSNALRVVFSK